MKKFLSLILLQVLCIFCATAGEKSKNLCNVPELVESQNAYNEKVCEGVSLMDMGRYKEAVVNFEKALQTDLFEVPNFQLLPRLALAYFYLGNPEKSKQFLGEAELALKVYTRILECVEKNGTFSIVKRSWSKYYNIDSQYQNQVAGMMCGDAYDYIYHPESLSVNIREAELVENYLSIKEKIEVKR